MKLPLADDQGVAEIENRAPDVTIPHTLSSWLEGSKLGGPLREMCLHGSMIDFVNSGAWANSYDA